jgi:hypothetical protein
MSMKFLDAVQQNAPRPVIRDDSCSRPEQARGKVAAKHSRAAPRMQEPGLKRSPERVSPLD